MNKEKVLVCDDDPGMRRLLADVLKAEGYRVLEAEDGTRALELVRSENPQLLLAEIRLPDMDGLEVLAEAKKAASLMPVIFLSGFADVESAVSAIKQGAFDYLTKPFRLEDLRKTVRKALGERVQSREGLLERRETTVPFMAEAAAAPGKKKSHASRIALGLMTVAVLIAAAGAGALIMRPRFTPPLPDRQFAVPYSNATALCVGANGTLWAADWVTSSLYHHNLDNKLSVARAYPLPGGHPTGVAWDGLNLWTSNAWERKIYKHKMDDDLTVLAEYPSPGPEPAGLFWDGTTLWVADCKEAKFYRMKVSSQGLTVMNAYDSPGSKPVAICVTEDDFWSADARTNRLYRHSKDDPANIKEMFVADPYQDKKIILSGLAWDGDSFWTAADEHSLIHHHQPRNLLKINY